MQEQERGGPYSPLSLLVDINRVISILKVFVHLHNYLLSPKRRLLQSRIQKLVFTLSVLTVSGDHGLISISISMYEFTFYFIRCTLHRANLFVT